jgi:hypothetical protein
LVDSTWFWYLEYSGFKKGRALSFWFFKKYILKILEPKPRYLVGREAKALAFIALLPARWRAALLTRLVK